MSTATERREVYATDRWKRVRRDVLNAHGWRCANCGKAGRLQVHHIKPIKNGGAAFAPENLQPLCSFCHKRTHKLTTKVSESGKWNRHIHNLIEVTKNDESAEN